MWNDVKYLYYGIASKLRKSFPQFEADELVNEAWIKTYPYLDSPHLKHIIYQKMMEYIRSYRKLNILKVDRAVSHKGFKEVEDMDCLEVNLKGLDYDSRIALYLRYYLELTLEQMSRLYQLSVPTVRRILTTATKGRTT